MAVYDETKGSQSNTKDAANTSRSVSSAHACLPAPAPAGALGWLRKHGTSETAGACGSLLDGGVETLCFLFLFFS
jgi:hypothetical protein